MSREESNMLNERRKREKLPDYAVRFIGYSARIIARKGNAEYAFLDFVSGAAGLCTNEGCLFVTKRAALSSAVADLRSCVDKLKSLVKSVFPGGGGRVDVARGKIFNLRQ